MRMMLLPEPISADDYLDIVEAAAAGELITGPWNAALDSALSDLASEPSIPRQQAALAALHGWVAEWNSSLPA